MTQILISVSHIYISDRYIIFMILVLENMDIQDIVLFNYDDTINGTSLHTLQGFPSCAYEYPRYPYEYSVQHV